MGAHSSTERAPGSPHASRSQRQGREKTGGVPQSPVQGSRRPGPPFARNYMGKIDWPQAFKEILFMERAHALDLGAQGRFEFVRQNRVSVLASLAAANGNLTVLKIHPLDPKPQRLPQPQSRIPQERSRQPRRSLELRRRRGRCNVSLCTDQAPGFNKAGLGGSSLLSSLVRFPPRILCRVYPSGRIIIHQLRRHMNFIRQIRRVET